MNNGLGAWMFTHRMRDALWAAECRLLGSEDQCHKILPSILAYSVLLSIKILKLWGLAGIFTFAFPPRLARCWYVEDTFCGGPGLTVTCISQSFWDPVKEKAWAAWKGSLLNVHTSTWKIAKSDLPYVAQEHPSESNSASYPEMRWVSQASTLHRAVQWRGSSPRHCPLP